LFAVSWGAACFVLGDRDSRREDGAVGAHLVKKPVWTCSEVNVLDPGSDFFVPRDVAHWEALWRSVADSGTALRSSGDLLADHWIR
jgi:hypothetical protein